MKKFPRVNISILVINSQKILLGLLTKKWMVDGKQMYGTPGRDIHFGETMGEAVKRNIKEEINCEVVSYKIICVNANYEWGNHYIGIGATAEIIGEPKLMKPEDWESWEWFDMNLLPSNLLPEAKYLITCRREEKVNVSE